MAAPNEDDRFEQLIRKLEPRSRLLRAWELKGGVSAQVTALEIELPGGHTRKLVVRKHGSTDLERNPNIAADEFRLLQTLQSAGLPAPRPYHLDQSGDLFPTPYVVLEYIEGEPDFAPSDLHGCLLKLAQLLFSIHSVDLSAFDLSYLPGQEDIYNRKLTERPAKLDESIGEWRIRDTLETAWPFPRRNLPVLLHGDFWPGNILWREGRLVGVLDWEDAGLGDPLEDLGKSRLEMLWAFGVAAMHSFTRHYQSVAALDYANLPYWDLCAALRPAFKLTEWASDDDAERAMREKHAWFVEQAFEKLAAQ
ncbi:MAG: phosphotransferase family protein [Chloroflexia bacterium]